MKIQREARTLAVACAVFLGLYHLPVGHPRFDGAVSEALAGSVGGSRSESGTYRTRPASGAPAPAALAVAPALTGLSRFGALRQRLAEAAQPAQVTPDQGHRHHPKG